MLYYRATVRQRGDRTRDLAYAVAGGKPLQEYLKILDI